MRATLMTSPPHPGGVIPRHVIAPLGLSVTEVAGVLGVTRQALSPLLNERTDLWSEMALRIEKARAVRQRERGAYKASNARKCRASTIATPR